MITQDTFVERIRELVEQECRQAAPDFLADADKTYCSIDALRTMSNTLSRLARDVACILNDESHPRTDHQYEQVVRKLIEQKGYLAECCNSLDVQDYEKKMQLYVHVLCRAIRKARFEGSALGRWHNKPATPIMFG